MKSSKLYSVIIIGLILLFGFSFCRVNHVSAQQQFIRGDADGDCLVGISDIVFLICYLYSAGAPPSCMDAADANDDGILGVGEIATLISYLFHGGFIPPPFPTPGLDPTPDGLGCASACISPSSSTTDSLIAFNCFGSMGDTVSLPILVKSGANLVRYQIYLKFDPTVLEVIDADTVGTVTGAVGPDEFYYYASNGEIEITCSFDCALLSGLPATRDTLVKVKCKVLCGTTNLDLVNTTGQPFRGNLLDYSTIGEVYPILVDGQFTSKPPLVTSIKDVPNDQGRQIRVKWNRSCYDATGSPVTINQYGIYRRIDQEKSNNSVEKPEMSKMGSFDSTRLYPPGDWDFITTVPARGEETYNTICPTLGDSTIAEGMYWSVFFVSAMTPDPLVYYDSPIDSGYSLDNIPPLPIMDLDVNPSSWFTMDWTVPGEYPEEHPISDYDIRYNTVPVSKDTQAWWNSAVVCPGVGVFHFIVGQTDTFKVANDTTWLHPNVYFAVKGLDERPNASEISNTVHFICGDVNASGLVELGDVVYLISYVYKGGTAPKPLATGDCNRSSEVELGDIVKLISYLYKSGTPPCSL